MLWIPGPTEVRPEILAECARPMIGHRSAAMVELHERIDPHLRLAFGLPDASEAHVAVHSTSASGLMETALRGVDGRVLCVVNGAFSRRFHQIALSLGLEAEALEVELGRGVEEEELRDALDERGPFSAVTVVSNETSTGVRTPLADVAGALEGHPETLLLVDLVSYIAGAPVDFDAHRVDFALAGVQKALALPPGVSVLCASERYLARARRVEPRGWYLDPVRTIEGHEAKKTPATPCIPLYFALARQLEDISGGVTLPPAERHLRGREAWSARFAKHERMRARTAAWAAGHRLSLFPAARFASPTVSCIEAGGLDVAALVAGLKQRGFEISNGYGDLKGRTFRIGHMGDHDEPGLERLLAAADEVLAALGSPA